MARSPGMPPLGSAMPISLISPGPGDRLSVDASGNIEVSIDNPDDNNFAARIHDFFTGSGSPMGPSYGEVPLSQDGSTSRYFAMVPAGPVTDPAPMSNNKFARVHDLTTGDVRGNQFIAVPLGSGSGSGSILAGPGGSQLYAAAQARFSQKNQPIPATLTLKVDSPIAEGELTKVENLNRPALLQHSLDPRHVGRWFSQPLNLGTQDGRPGLWILEKSDLETWTLVLLVQQTKFVIYQLTLEGGRDCTFPIRLSRMGAGGRQFKKWSKSVTISLGA